MSLQWDALLLEAGMSAVPLAASFPGMVFSPCLFAAGIWPLHLLLFRLMFSSGAVKLRSQCPEWKNARALDYHYETQPLPHGLAWYAHHRVPRTIHKVSVLLTLLLEVVLPFAIFGGRQLRLVAALGTSALQLLIMATGNYGFFNILTIALCLSTVDDQTLVAATTAAFSFSFTPTAST